MSGESQWRASFCVLQGLIARHAGKGASANPYRKGSPEARCWRHGHNPVSRETVPRRSHDARGEIWPEADEALVAFAAGDLADKDIAAIIGVTHQAVRGKRHRMRKEARAAA